ncbi:MAG: hypothetical protein Kow0010_23830 [Dehalococcoidia bacterium]
MAEKYLVRIGDEDLDVEVRRDDGIVQARFNGDGDWHTVELLRVEESGLYVLMLDNHPLELYLEEGPRGADVTIGRHVFKVEVGRWSPPAARRSRRAPSSADGRTRVVAPMTGSIIEVRCAPGDTVEQGDTLLIIESMKMNNELRSPAAGVVESVQAKAGQRVQGGEVLVVIRAAESRPEA